MATLTSLKAIGNNKTTLGSSKLKLIPSFPKHLSLYDWWLIKADTPFNGRVLGVGGLSSTDFGVRMLHSAAIVKRHNTNTVETADGLTITFSGSINKLRTVLNGFPSEVCDQFIFGFPYCWEELFSESFAKEASNSAVDNSPDAANIFLSKSFDNLPVALVRDFFVSTIESSESRKLRSIFVDMLHTCGVDSLNQRSKFVSPSKKNTQVAGHSAENETHGGHKEMKVKRKQKDEDDTPDAKTRNQFQKVARELGLGPSTRSMTTRMKAARCKQDKDNVLSSSGKSQLIKSLAFSEAPIKQHGGLVTRTLSLRNRSIDFM